MTNEWDYESVTLSAAAIISAIVAEAEGKFGETALLYECEAGGVFRLWASIVGEAALDDDLDRLRAMLEQVRPQPPDILKLQ